MATGTERTTRTSARTINTSHSTFASQSKRSENQSQRTLMSGSEYPEEYDELMDEVTESVYSFVKERENAWNVERAALIKQYEQLKQSAAKIEDLSSELRLLKEENIRLRRKLKTVEPVAAAAPIAEAPSHIDAQEAQAAPAQKEPEATPAPAPVFKKVTIRGEKYFVKEGLIYRQDADAEGGYVPVGSIVNGQAKFDRK